MDFRLKEILRERKLTISAFAEMAGITQANMSNIANLKSSPSLDTLNRIAKALNIPITELFGEEEDIELSIKYRGKVYKITKELIIKAIEISENFEQPTV